MKSLLLAVVSAVLGSAFADAATPPCALSAGAEEKVDPRVRTYVPPVRIVWKSDCTDRSSVTNAEVLLKPRFGQVSEGSFLAHCGCVLENKGENASILLDFGREIHGGVAIGQGHGGGAKVRVRFGESVAEAMANLGEKGAQSAHSARDDVHELPWLGTTEIGNTGFRFVRIDLVSGGKAELEAVRAVSLMRPMPRLGSFRSSDERLNRIWATAARTAHLCSQDYLWDGIKRDRLVWMGDMHPEICALLAAFGAASVIPESLDYIRLTTPVGGFANNMGTYSYWMICGFREWWFFTGDLKWLEGRRAYLRDTLAFLAKQETEDGRNTLDGLLDWPTHNNIPAEQDGRQALRVMAFRAGLEMAEALGDGELATLCRETLARAVKPEVDPRGENSAAAVMAIAGLRSPREMYDTVIGRNGIAKFSTFYGYYMLEAMSLAGEDGRALDVLRDYWGGMLDMGATSFWEDFDVSWTNNAFRVDQLPQPGKKDIHGDFGQFCYVGFRHSLCHGWSSGPAAWLSRHVLGVERLSPGGRKVRIRPFLGDLSWAEGDVPLASGVLRVRHERRPDGTVDTKVLSCPAGVEVVGSVLRQEEAAASFNEDARYWPGVTLNSWRNVLAR